MNYKYNLGIIAAGTILSAGLAVSVTAQSGAVPASRIQDPKVEGQTERKVEGRTGRPDLNLSADQKAQLKSIRQNQRDQIMSLRDDKNLSQEQRMAKVRAIREGTRQQVLGVLTPQQQEIIKNARGEGRKRGRGPGRSGDRALDLSAEQRAQLRSIHQSTMAQVKAVRNDSTLTQEQKSAKLQEIRQSTRQQMSGFLTTEQQQRMKEGRRGGPRGGPGRFGGPGGRRGGPFGPGRPGGPAGATQTPPDA